MTAKTRKPAKQGQGTTDIVHVKYERRKSTRGVRVKTVPVKRTKLVESSSQSKSVSTVPAVGGSHLARDVELNGWQEEWNEGSSKGGKRSARTGKVNLLYSSFRCTLSRGLFMKGQNDMLRDWLPKRDAWLAALMQAEAPIEGRHCSDCGKADSAYRCKDCFGTPAFCKSCCQSSHRRHPMHKIQVWNKNHYGPCDLNDIGFVIELGHHGSPCLSCPQDENSSPSPVEAMDDQENEWVDIDDKEMVVVGLQGVTKRRVRWCRCPNAATKEMQLLEVGMMPLTAKRTGTVFMFDVLEDFHMSRLECNTTAMNYFQKLRRLTDNALQKEVSVCCSAKFTV